MSRRGHRSRIARNISRDRTGLSVKVKLGGLERERRFPRGTSIRDLQAARDELRVELRRAATAPASRGTFAADVVRYLAQVRHLVSWVERRAELRAWVARVGPRPRARLTPADVRRAIGDWVRAGLAPKTCNNRLHTLRHLYHTLDGAGARTPCDGIRPLPVPITPKTVVSADVIRAVEATLRGWEATGRLRTAKTRARFMVLATTGKRPSELKRTRPGDVDLERRVWAVRTGKGGRGPGIYLNDEMLVAWQVFVDADAWGSFEVNAYVRTLRAAGWPKDLNPYQLRHSVAITMLEQGIDLGDVSAHLGHSRIDTTRRHYAPILGSRLQAASEALDGRFGWGKKGDEPGAPAGGTSPVKP